MNNIYRMILANNLAKVRASIPALNSDEQTRSSWAKPIRSIDDVPDVFKEFIEPIFETRHSFPYSVLTPSYEGFLHRTTEKLLCDWGNEITILERKSSTIEIQRYPIDRIYYIEMRLVLLDGHLKICGMTDQDIPAVSTLRFNAVTDYLFTPILKTLRPIPFNAGDSTKELEKFDCWIKVNYKFMNYARRSLRMGDKVIHTILQPEIRIKILTILGKSYHLTISPAHVSILTDSELILISEEASQGEDDRYGGLWDYIPLNKIQKLTFDVRQNDLFVLTIHLLSHECLEYLYQESAREEVEQLIARFEEMNSRGIH